MGAVAFANYHDGNLAAILVMTFTVVSGLVAPRPEKPKLRQQAAEATPRETTRLVEAWPAKASCRHGRAIGLPRPISHVFCRPMAAQRNHFGLRFRPRRAHGLSRDRGGAAGHRFHLRRRRRRLSLWRDGRSGACCPHGRIDGRTDRDPPARPYRHRLQHRLYHRAAGAAQEIRAAVRRHRAGDQARLRGLCDAPRVRPRHRGDGRARIHPRAHSRLCRDCQVTLVGSKRLAGYAEAELAGTPVDDAAIARGARPLLRRRRRTHRHRCPRLHPLSAAARPAAAARPMAGELSRSGAGNRAPRGRSARPGAAGAAIAGATRAIFTSGRAPAAALARFGIGASA